MIQHRSLQKVAAHGIDEHPRSEMLDHSVAIELCADFHGVLQAGASALLDTQTQAVARTLGGD